MIKYNPTHCKYSGDTNIRPDTQNKQPTRDNGKDYARGKIFRLSSDEDQISNSAKNPKKPSIDKVPIHVYVGISHRYSCISSLQKQEIIM